MLAGLARSLLLAGGGVAAGLGIVAALYGPRDLVDSVRSTLAPERPAVTAPAKPEWGEANVDLGRPLLPADPGAAPSTDRPASGPSLDIVRVEPSGDAVIAGRGAPNATVEILRDNKPYASGIVDETGQFAIVPPALPAGNSELTYRTIGPGQKLVMGKENVVVVVPDKPDTRPLVAVGKPDKPTEVLSQPGAPAKVAVAEGKKPDSASPAAKPPESAPAGAKTEAKPGTNPEATKAAAKSAVKSAAKPPERVTALPEAPSNTGAGAEKKPDLKIVSVDAQEGGRLDVSGRASAWSTLRLYLNDTLVATGKAGPDGRIAFTIGRGVSPGGYQIRLDQVDPGNGKVAHRAQVSFAFPDSPAAKTAARGEPAPQPNPKPTAPLPPPIPERPASEAAARPAETAARVAATPPPAPAAEARAAARRSELAAPAPASVAAPSAPAASFASPDIQAPDGRPLANLAEAPSGLTTTWVQPPAEPARRPVVEKTPAVASAANPEALRPSRAPEGQAADVPAPALPPAAKPAPQQAETPAPAAPTEAAPSRPEQGLASTAPAPSTPGQTGTETARSGAVFVPEISTAKITRGDSLWVISKRTYGSGLRYTVIFDANQDQIRDPDLIYPGQIFVLPKDAPRGHGAQRG